MTTPARGGTHGAQLLYPRLRKAPVETTWDVFVLACLSANQFVKKSMQSFSSFEVVVFGSSLVVHKSKV